MGLRFGMNVRDYCDMLSVTKGIGVNEDIIKSAEVYMKNNVLDMSVIDVVEWGIHSGKGYNSDLDLNSLIQLGNLVKFMRKHGAARSKVEEFKCMARGVIGLRSRGLTKDGLLPWDADLGILSGLRTDIDMQESYMAGIVITSSGSYDKNNKILRIMEYIIRDTLIQNIRFENLYKSIAITSNLCEYKLVVDNNGFYMKGGGIKCLQKRL